MPVAVALYDAQDFRLLAANTLFHSLLNPAWQNGRALGHPPTDWVVGANVTTIENMLRRVVETGIPYRASELAIHSSFHGTTYWALTIEPVRDNDRHIIQLLQTANDVTTQVSEAREVLIWVRDWGMGISAGELPHNFERFHRASTLDRSISGLGIGLYLAKELVERHRGRIWVESSEGQGSKFYVRLPLQKRVD